MALHKRYTIDFSIILRGPEILLIVLILISQGMVHSNTKIKYSTNCISTNCLFPFATLFLLFTLPEEV